MRLGYWRLKQWAVPLAVLGVVLLLAVWIPHIGQHENGAARWVKLGIRFQPSELAKLTLLLYVAAQLARPACKIRHLTEGLGPTLLVTGFYLLADRARAGSGHRLRAVSRRPVAALSGRSAAEAYRAHPGGLRPGRPSS